MNKILSLTLLATLVAASASAQTSTMMMSMSSPFKGIEVNGGTVSFEQRMGKPVLMLSDDFKIPMSPAPHWQVVDNMGNTFLLKQLKIAGDRTNRSITLPKYIHSVRKVQIWCSFAEVVLGEATFAKPVVLH